MATNVFENLEFTDDIVSQAVMRWKDIQTGTFYISDRNLIAGKYGEVFILDLKDPNNELSRVYTTKAITEYLKKHNPKCIRIRKDKNDFNVASFAF